MNDANARQQIVEKIQDSSNILVTVSQSPTVDELSAALGLTIMLNAMNKHATAIFSGTVPPAIDFLRPGKTFENTVDSLRDFIIALDKEKADHLRYKVDGDVVKIFITPYRTTIGEKDLDFSQGDYNVELVLALGVTSQDHLDKALEAHGRIFHDATVATLTVGETRSELGSIGWNERSVSSLSEMVVGLADALRKDKNLLDEQIATALLTGVVATTDRFSNNLTSPKVMTIAAQLMAAGANQQLIATKLQEAHEIKSDDAQSENSDGSTDLTEGKSSKVKKNQKQSKQQSQKNAKDGQKKKDGAGELLISHEKRGDLDEVGEQTHKEQLDQSTERAEEALAEQKPSAPADPVLPAPTPLPTTQNSEQELQDQLASITDQPASSTVSVADLQKDLAAASADVDKAAEQPPVEPVLPAPAVPGDAAKQDTEPTLGGTLNATTEQAADDKRREEEKDRNRTILSHEGSSYMGNQTPSYNAPLNASMDPSQDTQKPLSDPMSGDTAPTAPAPSIVPTGDAGMTLAQLDKENRAPHEEARSAIDAAFAAQPSSSDGPAASSAMPPLPDFSTLPPLPPQFAGAPDGANPFQFEQTPPSASLQPASTPPQQPQASPQPTPQQPTTPQAPRQPQPPTAPLSPQQPASVSSGGVSDPGQFKIPGQ